MSTVLRPCLACGELTRGISRCVQCERTYQKARNARPQRASYRDPSYLAAVRFGICHICGGEGADTRDHVVPLNAGGDNSAANIKPAHRSCNSAKGATQ